MNYLAVKSIGKNFGERILFEGLTLGIAKGEKIALIADNGTGKSTLLKILVGLDEPDQGEITRMNGLRIGFLAQDPDFDPDLSIQQLINEELSHVLTIIARYRRALEQAGERASPELDELTTLMEQHNGWDYERQLTQILSRFGFRDYQRKLSSFSGGEQKRLALALVLLDQPDLLILDEPTNHLDIGMIEWLEGFLAPATTTLLVVSHDRYFLDQVCNHIWELSDGKLFHHQGNYAYYLEKRSERLDIEKVELGKSKRLFLKELEWMRRSPQARTSKAKSRIDKFYTIKEEAHSGKVKQELRLDFKMERLGGKIIELHNIFKTYDDTPIISDFTYTFKRNDKVGIVGPNGSGKSTLLRIISGEEGIDRGKIKRGQTLQIGYYRQEGITFKPEQRVIDILKEIADVIVLSNGRKVSASEMLMYFQFSRDMQQTHVARLSGGERRRLYLLTVLMANPNFLILDEPTNDLDLATLNKLEEFLLNYQGCVIMVSHDRYFMDNLVDQLFVFEGEGKIRGYVGTYSEYRQKFPTASVSKEKIRSQQALDYEETKAQKREAQKKQRDLLNLEKSIEKLENRKAELEQQLADSTLPIERITELSEEVGRIMKEIDLKTEEWMLLTD